MGHPQLILQSERLAFSTWSPSQIGDVIALHRDLAVTQHLSGRIEDEADAKRRMGVWADEFEKYGWCKFRVMRKSDGAFIGRAGFGLEEGEPEIGYAISHAEWGKGYAQEAAFALRDWIFRATDHQSFIGYAFTQNLASVHILKKIGMQFTHTDVDDSGKELSFHKLTKEQWHG
ncbi:GNAT family N-acetyltransferase [Maritalea porphyrae]|uniref:GNAT family N-acetyltransferase n=1 Tax=Maritalea porphyrae TaxID=880732 RepID=UPI0022AE7FF6|nr:GNAT family N-acetyltransferase [Maritalea porphyrae]MCZ4271339.1 GNAT family N-acetyltransferase [Maritalea porphyrae]